MWGLTSVVTTLPAVMSAWSLPAVIFASVIFAVVTALEASFAVVIPSDAPVESLIFAVSTASFLSSDVPIESGAISTSANAFGEIWAEPTASSAMTPCLTLSNAMIVNF